MSEKIGLLQIKLRSLLMIEFKKLKNDKYF